MDGRFPWPAFWAPTQQEWGWPPEGSSGSPASSPDSGSLSPAQSPLCPAAAPRPSVGSAPWRASLRGPKGGRGARLGQGQRRSASQREKLRMRRLARALHTLRRFLPPSVAPAGQSLTKIETLRLAIRYIGHLSELLAGRCHSCPPGLGCCQPQPERPAGPAAEFRCWACPPGSPRPPAFQGPSSSPQGTGGSAGPPASPVAAAASWLADHRPDGRTSATSPGDGGNEAEALLLPAELADLGLSPQSLPGELVAFLEGLLPAAALE